MIVFDIETDGLYSEVTQLFCITLLDTRNNEYKQYSEDRCTNGVLWLYEQWKKGETVVGHNIINYDLPVLAKLYSWFHLTPKLKDNVIDTLVLSRLIFSHLEDTDAALMRRGVLPKKLYKSHSLKAWGYRLGELKGTYGETEGAWDKFTLEMLKYNKQDVVVTKCLYDFLIDKHYPQGAIDLEHAVAWLMSKQEKNGFPFDKEKAGVLEAELRSRAGELKAEMTKIIPSYPYKIFVPKRDNKRLGYKAGVPVQKYKEFNPNSRQQIEWLVRTHYNYEPSNPDCYDIPDDTMPLKDCRLKIDEESLHIMQQELGKNNQLSKILKDIEELLMLNKRLGQLADGKNAWLSMIDTDGRIHGSVIPNGAVSGRATHSRPNVAQVPHVGSPYGKECRELFNSGNWYQAGIDACGLELRCLAHFMYPYDHGEYAHTILNGDIHTMNQKAAGLPTRTQAKTFNKIDVYKLIENGENL